MSHPLHALRGDLRKLRFLAQTHAEQWLPTAALSRLSRARRGRFVRYCYDHNDFYRQRWAGLGTRAALSDDAAFTSLPILGKDDIRSAGPERMLSEGFRLDALQESRTSGSSGSAVRLVFSDAEVDHSAARQYRGMTMAGCRPHHRVAYSRMAPIDLDVGEVRGGNADIHGLFPTHHVPFAYAPGERVASLRAASADYYCCYPSHAAEIVREVDPERLKALRLRGIVLNSEYSSQAQRDALGEAFGCKVYDDYGAEEFWAIATMCSHGSYHVASDALHLEIVDDDGNPKPDGEVGHVVITTFVNRAMPLVRYRIGDLAALAPKPCPCGRGTPVLTSLDGRAQDYFVTPDGRRISALHIHCLFDHTAQGRDLLPSLQGLQIVQQRPEAVEIQYITGPATDVSALDSIARDIRGVLGEQVSVAVERVGELYRTSSGKVPQMRCLAESSMATG